MVNLGATLSGMAVGGGGTTMIRSLAATPTEIVVGLVYEYIPIAFIFFSIWIFLAASPDCY